MPTEKTTNTAANPSQAACLLGKRRDRLIADCFEDWEGCEFMDRHAVLLDQYFMESFAISRIGQRMHFHENPYAMIALGGYGRRELCLHSDIDILVLFEKRVPEETRGLIEEVLYPLWDLGFEVGHATRSLKECLRMAAADISSLTALLDGRFICGMPVLYERLREGLNQYVSAGRSKKIIATLLDDNRKRHERFGDSSFLLEPNLKEGRGGLRDYHTMLWTAMIKSKIKTPRDLEYSGYLSCEEYRQLQQSLAFIWKVRNHLHLLAKKKSDLLYFEHQEALAERLGFTDLDGQMAVERFLGELHAAMSFLKQINLIFMMETGAEKKSTFIPELLRKNPSDKNFTVKGNLIGFAAPETIHQTPELLLRIFDHCARMQLTLNREARRMIKEFSYLIDEKFRTRAENIKSFERILKTPAAPFNVLSEMLATGFLEKFVPPISSIVNRIQYDGYHLYPIDRHSLETVRIMKTFTADIASAPLTTDLYHDVGRYRVELLWAALLHDIGKGLPGQGHSQRGADIAGRYLKSMGYASGRIETVAFLITNHLFLIKTATLRDINDEDTIIHCARKIESAQRLKMLYLLTVADSMATGPKAWNDWTATLLRELFFKTLKIIEAGELASRSTVAGLRRKIMSLTEAAASEDERIRRRRHLETLSPRYLLYTKEAAIIDHMRLYEELKEKPFVWRVTSDRERLTRTVTICAPDSPGLFSRVAGVFALSGLDILEAEIYTWKNNIALDIFTVRPPSDLIYEEEKWRKTVDLLTAAMENRLDPAALLREKSHHDRLSVPAGVRPHRIVIDNNASEFFTIIEVFCNDRPGLLFHITSTLFDHGLDVRVAKIGTKIDQAADVFYVRDESGQKMNDPDRIKKLRTAIEKVLCNRDPP